MHAVPLLIVLIAAWQGVGSYLGNYFLPASMGVVHDLRVACSTACCGCPTAISTAQLRAPDLAHHLQRHHGDGRRHRRHQGGHPRGPDGRLPVRLPALDELAADPGDGRHPAGHRPAGGERQPQVPQAGRRSRWRWATSPTSPPKPSRATAWCAASAARTTNRRRFLEASATTCASSCAWCAPRLGLSRPRCSCSSIPPWACCSSWCCGCAATPRRRTGRLHHRRRAAAQADPPALRGQFDDPEGRGGGREHLRAARRAAGGRRRHGEPRARQRAGSRCATCPSRIPAASGACSTASASPSSRGRWWRWSGARAAASPPWPT
jgi:hypothetical protein